MLCNYCSYQDLLDIQSTNLFILEVCPNFFPGYTHSCISFDVPDGMTFLRPSWCWPVLSVTSFLSPKLSMDIGPRTKEEFARKYNLHKGVFLVMAKNVFLPVERIFSVNIYSRFSTVP